ncbi:prolargin [Brienomyrus brachyistius]|uniref:prolargin n=1 Tax=Brienomyrus brachyistius TaxID=42636 RepID=UPI0020B3D1CF|nr:prolargin [Brienomyrus brachyistius]XP_048860276.1 prolargin [Brienomyrus brachyistius]
MKAGFGYYLLLIFLLLSAVWAQRQPRPRPRPRPSPTRKPVPSATRRPVPSATRRPVPSATRRPVIPEVEPSEPTDFPPPILGPPSIFPDCPQECFCHPSYPESLNCENRNIRQIPLIPFRVQYLYLQNNYIDEVTSEPFKNATELKWVNLDNNRIRRVERQVFEKLPNLLYLYMDKNNLKEVPNNLPTSLEQLRLSHNQITKIPTGIFNKMDHLVLLDLHHNKLSDSDLGKNVFKGLRNLVQLNLAHNILRKMPSNVPQNIYQLFLDRNNIEDIPMDYFKDFHNLAFVRLNFNQLSDRGIPKRVFNVSSLLDLHLAHNKLNSVPTFNMHLEHLYLNDNNIEMINGTELCPFPVMSTELHDESLLPKLRYLRLDGNHVSPPIPLDVIMCFRNLKSIVM